MSKQDYLKDISEIKNIMNRSTRFLSLSGVSGILAGLYALIGGLTARKLLIAPEMLDKNFPTRVESLEWKLISIAAIVVILSATSGYILTKRKAKKNNEYIWTPVSKLMLESFMIPMSVGGIMVLMLIYKEYHIFIAPITLIFYGLALYNARRYTFSSVKYLGLLEIVLGLCSFWFVGKGLLFWIIGFGILHIVYGLLMYFKEEKKNV